MLSQSLACGILMSVCYTPHPSCLYGIVPHSCSSSSHLLKKHQLSCNDPKSVDQLLLYPMLDSYTVQLDPIRRLKLPQYCSAESNPHFGWVFSSSIMFNLRDSSIYLGKLYIIFHQPELRPFWDDSPY